MPHSPSVSGKELLKALQRGGFVVHRIRGSHHILRHQDGRKTVIPIHGGETLGPGILAKILRDCDMTTSDLIALL